MPIFTQLFVSNVSLRVYVINRIISGAYLPVSSPWSPLCLNRYEIYLGYCGIHIKRAAPANGVHIFPQFQHWLGRTLLIQAGYLSEERRNGCWIARADLHTPEVGCHADCYELSPDRVLRSHPAAGQGCSQLKRQQQERRFWVFYQKSALVFTSGGKCLVQTFRQLIGQIL